MDIKSGSVCDKNAKLQRKELVRRVYQVYSVLLTSLVKIHHRRAAEGSGQARGSAGVGELVGLGTMHSVSTRQTTKNVANRPSSGNSYSPPGLRGTSFDELFNQSYWKRDWIIHEIAVASKVTVICGGNPVDRQDVDVIRLSWNEFADFMSRLMRMTVTEAAGVDIRPLFDLPTHLDEIRKRFANTRKPIHLPEALHWTISTLSTDPRDKTFSLLGLCHDGPRFVPVPNYQQSLETILVDMSKAMMRMNRSLDLICLKGIASSSPLDMPTWVPNLPNIWASGMTIQENDLWMSQISDDYKPHDSDPIHDGSIDGVLRVRGYLVAEVETATSEMRRTFNYQDQISDPYWLRSVLSDADEKYPNLSDEHVMQLYDSIWKSLTISLLSQTLAVGVFRSCFSVIWTPEGRGAIASLALVEWLDSNFSFTFRGWTLRQWSQMSNVEHQPPHTAEQLQTFISTMDRVLSGGMRLARLINLGLNQELLAMAHPHVRQTDQVYGLKACSSPVILRKESFLANSISTHRVVGGLWCDWDVYPSSDLLRALEASGIPINLRLV